MIERAVCEEASAARNMMADELVLLPKRAFPQRFVGTEENE